MNFAKYRVQQSTEKSTQVSMSTSTSMSTPSLVTQCPTQQVKYVNRNVLSMFKALNKGCK